MDDKFRNTFVETMVYWFDIKGLRDRAEEIKGLIQDTWLYIKGDASCTTPNRKAEQILDAANSMPEGGFVRELIWRSHKTLMEKMALRQGTPSTYKGCFAVCYRHYRNGTCCRFVYSGTKGPYGTWLPVRI